MDKYVGKAGCHTDDEECCTFIHLFVVCLDRHINHHHPSALVRAWGELGVMRIMFAVAIFHAFMSLVTIGVKSSQDPRAALHNGLWLVKLVLLVGAMVGAFFINNTFFIGKICGTPC